VTCPVDQGKIVRRVKIVLWKVVVEQDSNARIHGLRTGDSVSRISGLLAGAVTRDVIRPSAIHSISPARLLVSFSLEDFLKESTR
jgi:hypothetical protein